MREPFELDETWARRLAAGDRESAWDDFLARYRNLIFATIGRLVRDSEERMDAFALVCEKLRETDFRRLRRFEPEGPARFSTWLVTVVRNLVVDWYRQTHGRRRLADALGALGDLHRLIFERVVLARMPYVEAYESLSSEGAFDGGFGAFLRAVRELYREIERREGPLARELVGVDPAIELASGPVLPNEARIDYQRVLALLETMPADVRAATLLFVVDDVPAEQVARIVGWPNRKAVYNRVYRALANVRRRLEARGEQSDPGGP